MLDSDIKSFHALEVSNASTNGGRMSNNQIISGVVNNVIPHIDRATRSAGNIENPLRRKICTLAADVNNETLLGAIRWIERVLDSGDFCTMHAGTHTDTQGDIDGTERCYGYAFLKNDINIGDASCIVTVKDAMLATGAKAIFQAGDNIRPSTMQTPSGAGNEEFLVADAVAVNGLDITLTLPAGTTFANAYLANDGGNRGFVVSYRDIGDVKCLVSNFLVTAAGDYAYDHVTYPVIPDNNGTVYDHVVGTWLTATTFSAVGTITGINYGNGDKAVDFVPMNAAKAKPYFTLEAAGHSGTPQANDTFEFDIAPAAFYDWLTVYVPPACPSLANNRVTAVTVGESVS